MRVRHYGCQDGNIAPRQRKKAGEKKRLLPALVCIMVVIALGVMVLDTLTPSPGIDGPVDAGSFAKNIPAASHYQFRRFPQSGSKAFAKQCPWAKSGQENCTVIFHPIPGNEGLAEWIGGMVQAFLLAQQAGCHFRFDYGPTVDLSQVLSIPEGFNWTIPRDFVCEAAQRCFEWKTGYSDRHRNSLASQLGRDSLAPVPQYRFAYTKPLNASGYDQLKLVLTNFSLELGMACVTGTLLHLSLAAAQFEPRLFDRMLPALHDPNALVMTLYMRTGHTDNMVKSEKKGQGDAKDDARIRIAERITSCALKLEDEFLNAESGFSKVVWCVVSDSPATRQWAIEKYHGQRVVLPGMPEKQIEAPIMREVLATGSRGVHSRASRGPSTADFADAFIDWYLIGESDLVITGSQATFGAMGALRTARPLYGIHAECTKAILLPTST